MKHRKRIITLVLAAAMFSASTFTAFAEKVEITADNESQTGKTQIKYDVDPVYTVVIPSVVTLGESDVVEQIEIYGLNSESNIVIPSTKKVNVTVSESKNGFAVKNDNGDTISYTVNDKSDSEAIGSVAYCNANDKTTTDITFATTGDIIYSGNYTDQLTFLVELTDK